MIKTRMISGQLLRVPVVLLLPFLGAGLLFVTGFALCPWLSLMWITESCDWEPRNWVPGIPGGIFGRTVELSSLICRRGGLRFGRWPCVGWWTGLVVHACSHRGLRWAMFGSICHVCSKFLPYFCLLNWRFAYKLLKSLLDVERMNFCSTIA